MVAMSRSAGGGGGGGGKVEDGEIILLKVCLPTLI